MPDVETPTTEELDTSSQPVAANPDAMVDLEVNGVPLKMTVREMTAHVQKVQAADAALKEARELAASNKTAVSVYENLQKGLAGNEDAMRQAIMGITGMKQEDVEEYVSAMKREMGGAEEVSGKGQKVTPSADPAFGLDAETVASIKAFFGTAAKTGIKPDVLAERIARSVKKEGTGELRAFLSDQLKADPVVGSLVRSGKGEQATDLLEAMVTRRLAKTGAALSLEEVRGSIQEMRSLLGSLGLTGSNQPGIGPIGGPATGLSDYQIDEKPLKRPVNPGSDDYADYLMQKMVRELNTHKGED